MREMCVRGQWWYKQLGGHLELSQRDSGDDKAETWRAVTSSYKAETITVVARPY